MVLIALLITANANAQDSTRIVRPGMSFHNGFRETYYAVPEWRFREARFQMAMKLVYEEDLSREVFKRRMWMFGVILGTPIAFYLGTKFKR